MTPEQKELVKSSFEKVLPISATAASLFYGRLFKLDPSLRPLFKGDMAEQGRKLMDMIRIAVKGLDKLDSIVPVVQQLGQRHAAYGVQDHHYVTVGMALLWTLEQGLGQDFTPETEAAWTEVYLLLSGVMKEAAVVAA